LALTRSVVRRMEGIPRRCLARTWFLGGFPSVPSAESGAGGVRGGCGGNGSGGGRGVGGGGASELDTESHPIGELLCGRERRPRLTTGRRGRRGGGCGGDSDGSGGGGGGGSCRACGPQYRRLGSKISANKSSPFDGRLTRAAVARVASRSRRLRPGCWLMRRWGGGRAAHSAPPCPLPARSQAPAPPTGRLRAARAYPGAAPAPPAPGPAKAATAAATASPKGSSGRQ
jgi:hypothetical protein